MYWEYGTGSVLRRSPHRLCAPIITLSLLAVASAGARAQVHPHDPEAPAEERDGRADGLDWPYPRFRPVEYVVTFGAPLLFRLIDHNTTEAASARWTGPVLLDEPMRDLLVPDGAAARNDVEIASDYVWYGTMALPVLDTLVTPLLVHGDPDVAWQMMAINVGAYALNGFITLLSIRAAARERPSATQCAEDPDYIELCDAGPLRSFPSGHTAGAFAGAGLYCAHHTSLPLYGGGLPDTAACVGALTAATGVALLRVSADRHYFSDVVVGAGIGLGVGWLLPWLLHYRNAAPSTGDPALVPDAGVRATVMPWTDGRGAGLDVLGMF